MTFVPFEYLTTGDPHTAEFYAAVHGLITLHGVWLAPSGLTRCRNYSCH